MAQPSQLNLKALDLRLESPNVIREGFDGTLLHARVWRPVESLLAESLFKEPEEGAWPSQVSLVDLPGHGVRQLRRHCVHSLRSRKCEASREEVL
jgi:hypothetical protein